MFMTIRTTVTVLLTSLAATAIASLAIAANNKPTHILQTAAATNAAAATTFTQPPPTQSPETIGYPEYPALHPTGRAVTFSWAGDIWIASTTSGKAARLTAHPAKERRSIFTHDGNRLVFESDRDGGRNLYTIDLQWSDAELPTAASSPRQITAGDTVLTLAGISRDNTNVYITGSIAPGIDRMPQMLTVPITGGPVTELTPALGTIPRGAPHSDRILFTRGRWAWERPRARGPSQMTLWAMDPDPTNNNTHTFTQLTSHPANNGDAFLLPDNSIIYLSSRTGQNNLFRLPPNATDTTVTPTQLTNFDPANTNEVTIAHGVADPTVAANGSLAAFVVWDTLYTLDLTQPNQQPRPLTLRPISADTNASDRQTIDVSRRADEAVLSPDGKTLAVIARGDVYIRSTEIDRPTRRVTNTHGRERDLAWSADGQYLYFTSDNSNYGKYALYKASVQLARQDLNNNITPTTETPAEPTEPTEPTTEPDPTTEDTQPTPSPSDPDPTDSPTTEEPTTTADAAKDDKDKSKPTPPDHGKRWQNAITFNVEQALSHDTEDIRTPVPSPDGRWLAYQRGRGTILLHSLTDPNATDRIIIDSWDPITPQWVADSRHIVYSQNDLDFNNDVWIHDTETGNRINISRHPDNDVTPAISADGKLLVFLSDRDNQNWSWDVYAVYLDRLLEGLTNYELADHFDEASKAMRRRKPPATPDAETKPADPITFHADDAFLRIRRLTSTPENESNLAITPAGERIIYSTLAGGAKLVSVKYDGTDEKVLHTGPVSDVRVNLTGDTVSFIAAGQPRTVPVAGTRSETLDITARITIDVAEQQRQKFREAAAIVGNTFYHPTLKGLDWQALTDRYAQLAANTRTSDAFNRVANNLFGELDGSHLGATGGDDPFSPTPPRTGRLGIDATPVTNQQALAPGYRVDRVLAGAPADNPNTKLIPGDIITAINNQPLADDTGTVAQDLRHALEGAAGIETLIEFVRPAANFSGDETLPGGQPSATRRMLIVPITSGAENNLRYENEVQRRRAEVERLSGGRLGYLHIRGMSEPSVRVFERDLFAAAEGKEALIIDVRDNGGGSTTDILLASLTAPPHAFTVPRGADYEEARERFAYPRDRRLIHGYHRPINVLINQNSFSNAEIFAHAIKTINRGRLIGKQTAGGVISTGSATLIDGGRVRVPFRGWYLPDGTDMENNGAQPHVTVEQTPADEAAGKDPQLEAAVQDLLRTLDQNNRR